MSKSKKFDFENSFCSDLSLPEMLHGILIRSPIEEGTVSRIIHKALPQNYSIFSAKDVPGEKEIVIQTETLPVFAEKISYLGEPIGILVGESLPELKKLLSEIVIHFEDGLFLSPLLDFTDTKKTFQKKQTTITKSFGDENIEQYFTEDFSVFEETYSLQEKQQSCSEPCCSIVNFQPSKLIAVCPTEWPFLLRNILSQTVLVPRSNIYIQKTLNTPNGSNLVWQNPVLCAQGAVASFHTQRPIKIVYSQKENNLFIKKLAPIFITHKIAYTEKGVLQALKITIEIEYGSACPFLDEIIERLFVTAASFYNAEHIHITISGIKTNNQPLAIDASKVESLAFFALEQSLNEIAKKRNESPITLRTRNLKNEKNSQILIDTSPVSKVIERTLAESDFLRKHITYKLNTNSRESLFSPIPIRGMGIALGFEGSGLYNSNINKSKISIELTMEKDGHVIIHTTPISPIVKKIWSAITSEKLDVEEKNITFDTLFTLDTEPPHPTFLQNNVSIMTSLLEKCCNAIQKMRFRQALPITVKRKIETSKKNLWNWETLTGKPFTSTSFSCVVVEVEVDPYTGKDTIKNIWITIEAGELFDKQVVIERIKKSVQETLLQIRDYDFVSPNKIHLSFVYEKKEAKQIGNLIKNTLPAAYMSALSQVLSESITSTYCQSETILKRLYIRTPQEQNEHEN
ncbi:MAG: xanthine dehydrogenase family protein [Spirochaetaceae bacterium]|nr:xanthine dehydrogenase family protein [Spirochaetaceae bacterium]